MASLGPNNLSWYSDGGGMHLKLRSQPYEVLLFTEHLPCHGMGICHLQLEVLIPNIDFNHKLYQENEIDLSGIKIWVKKTALHPTLTQQSQ